MSASVVLQCRTSLTVLLEHDLRECFTCHISPCGGSQNRCSKKVRHPTPGWLSDISWQQGINHLQQQNVHCLPSTAHQPDCCRQNEPKQFHICGAWPLRASAIAWPPSLPLSHTSSSFELLSSRPPAGSCSINSQCACHGLHMWFMTELEGTAGEAGGPAAAAPQQLRTAAHCGWQP